MKSSDEELKSPTKPEDQKNEVCMLDFTATFFNRLACGFLPASWALPYPVILGLSILPLVTAHKKSSSSSSSRKAVCFYSSHIYMYTYIYIYIYIYIGSLFLADRNVVCWSPVFKVISQWRCEISESSVKSRCVFVELFPNRGHIVGEISIVSWWYPSFERWYPLANVYITMENHHAMYG